MTTLKSLLLLTGLIFSIHSFAQAMVCIPANQPVAPVVADRTVVDAEGLTVDSPAWIAWKAQAGTATEIEIKKNLNCCPTLEMNPANRLCLDKSMMDPSLVKCESQADCSNKKGCFPLREDDMFKLDDNSTEAQITQNTALLEIFEQQQDEVEDPKPFGAICQRHMDCESYNCKRPDGALFATCVQAQNICRLADVGEVAPTGVDCGSPLEKDAATNKCYDPSISTFKGPLGTIEVVPTDAQKCQYALVPTAPGTTPNDLQPAIKLAITTTRGMEWLFTTSTHDGDCMKVINYLKAEVQKQVEIRKEILRDYNLNMKVIEDNFALINSAQKDVMEPQITTLCGDTTTPHDIAMRRATGLDFLCYMKERNKVFSLYEADMLIWTDEVNKIIDHYKSVVFSWDDGNKDDWTIGSNSYSWKNPKCRYYINALLVKITPKKKKKRWHQKYHVSNFAQNNEILESPNVKKYLSYIGDENTANQMKRGYYLDPIMPGGQGMDFKKFGNGQGMFNPATVAASLVSVSPLPVVGNLISGIGNGPDYNRNLRNGEMATMYGKYEPKLVEYLKGLRLDGVTEQDFIPEPEMPGSYENRGCLNRIDDPACSKFKAFVGDLRDSAWAQFLTYSKHHSSKYKHYYKSEGTFRKKLWNRYSVDLTNLQNYYVAVAKLRNTQNACIDLVINQIRGGGFSGAGMGITQGAGNYYVEGENNYNTGSGPKIVKAPSIKAGQNITPYQISLSVYNKGMKAGGLKGSVTSSSGGGAASMLAAASANLAARNKNIAEANAKAAASGHNIAKDEAEMRTSLSGGKLSASGAAASRSNSHSNMGSGSGGNKATLDEEGEMKTSASGATGVSVGANGGSAVGPGSAGNALSGLGLGSSSSSTDGSTTANQDASGMSDEEKDMMAANYDRTKTKYKTAEEDSLFQVVSKTYVRNLDKILTRKKKLDDNAIPAASTPSAP